MDSGRTLECDEPLAPRTLLSPGPAVGLMRLELTGLMLNPAEFAFSPSHRAISPLVVDEFPLLNVGATLAIGLFVELLEVRLKVGLEYGLGTHVTSDIVARTEGLMTFQGGDWNPGATKEEVGGEVGGGMVYQSEQA